MAISNRRGSACEQCLVVFSRQATRIGVRSSDCQPRRLNHRISSLATDPLPCFILGIKLNKVA